ncbi:MAG: sigma-54 dependent transcriptional regulator [Candidatus Eisenbacteria bacterium]|nr:sigma-54 dependent transcriptional regulator [Candidatus Eisenbacteria bacterium]
MRNTVLIVDDEEGFRWPLGEFLKDKGYNVFIAENGKQCMTVIDEEDVDVVLLDVRLKTEDGINVLKELRSRFPEKDIQVIMMTAFTTLDSAFEAGKYDCFRYVKKPFEMDHMLRNIEDAIKPVQLSDEIKRRKQQENEKFEIIGKSRQMNEILEKLRRIAPSAATVLIEGETGVGKELIARQIHNMAGRGMFVEVNCSAVPENLLESELFGYEKGAFTDAKKSKRGLAELASPGTLFLDEIGEMSLGLQSKLLRVLENKSFRKVGGTEEVRINARVIAATNTDLKSLAEQGKFREDLYYRLIVIPIYVPPLRERVEDIPVLIEHYAAIFSRELRKRVEVSGEAMQLFISYPWPGNVRELRNLVERIILLEDDDRILPEHLPPEVRNPSRGPGERGPDSTPTQGGPNSLKEIELLAIQDALKKSGGNKTKAAAILGISRQTLRAKLKECGLLPHEERSKTYQTR